MLPWLLLLLVLPRRSILRRLGCPLSNCPLSIHPAFKAGESPTGFRLSGLAACHLFVCMFHLGVSPRSRPAASGTFRWRRLNLRRPFVSWLFLQAGICEACRSWQPTESPTGLDLMRQAGSVVRLRLPFQPVRPRRSCRPGRSS